MKNFIDKHRKGLFIFSRNILFFLIALLLVDKFNIINVSRFVNNTFLIVLSFIFFFLSLFFYMKEDEGYYKKAFEPYFKYVFLGLLIIITISSLQFAFLQNINWFKFLSSLIKLYQLPLVLLSIGFGFFTFYFNRDEVEKEIEDEKIKEEKAEVKRKEEFSSKFPRINRVWGLRSLVKWMYGEGWWYSGLLILILLLFILFGTHHLGQFMSVDEPKWVDIRVPQLYDALSSGNWGNTYINDKPGVLPAFLSGFVNFFLDKDYYQSNPLIYEHYLFWWRLPIVLFNLILLIPIYLFSKKLFNKNIAILTTGLLGLCPILIGISQIVNPDATLWSTSLISILTFFIFLKENNIKYAIWSGIFLGLALLSKYFATLLLIIFFVALILKYLTSHNKQEPLGSYFYGFILTTILAIALYALLFPVCWVDVSQIFYGTFGSNVFSPFLEIFLSVLFISFFDYLLLDKKILNIIRRYKIIEVTFPILGILMLSLIGIQLISLFLGFGKVFMQNFLLNFDKSMIYNPLDILKASSIITIVTLTPLILFGLILSITYFYFKSKETIKFVFGRTIILFIFMFIVGASYSGFLVTARYQVMIYPLYAILLAIAIPLKKHPKKIILSILIISLVSLVSVCPFYLFYENSLNINNLVVTDSWGFGGYELAQIVNIWPNASNLTIWSDREGFNDFFIGNSFWRGEDNPFEIDNLNYLVLSPSGKRIFSNALIKEKLNNQSSTYSRIADELLDYYNKSAIGKIDINHNPNNFLEIVAE